MKKLNILHLGLGKVGRGVENQINKQRNLIKKEFGVNLVYKNKFTSKNSGKEILDAIQNMSLPFVLIDTTPSELTIPYISASLKKGAFAVLANKKPLSGSQKDFDTLNNLGKQRFFYESVAGAGLPVIQTLKNLIATGDEIIEIQGCFSGTLGFLFSQLDGGKSFSQAVIEAKEKGFTEPDPRDDLSGLDVARKALVLARLIGKKIQLKDIDLVGLYPKEMTKLNVEEFMKQVDKLDGFYKEKVEKAKKQGKVLRFVANVSQKICRVGLTEVNHTSDIGSLKGPDNLIVFKTKRYSQNPLVVKGPGAGLEVTASGVFADVLSCAKMI